MKDAQCAETNEKSIFRFLFFELWLIVLTILDDPKKSFKSGQIYKKNAQCSETDFLVMEFFFPVIAKVPQKLGIQFGV